MIVPTRRTLHSIRLDSTLILHLKCLIVLNDSHDGARHGAAQRQADGDERLASLAGLFASLLHLVFIFSLGLTLVPSTLQHKHFQITKRSRACRFLPYRVISS